MAFWKKKEQPIEENTPTDEALAKSAVTRELSRRKKLYAEQLKFYNDQMEIQHRQEQLEIMRSELMGVDDDDDEPTTDNPENMVMGLLAKKFLDGGSSPQPLDFTGTQPPIESPPKMLSDDDILGLVSELQNSGAITKKQLAFFKKQKPVVKRKLLDAYAPQFDDDTKERIIKVVV